MLRMTALFTANSTRHLHLHVQLLALAGFFAQLNRSIEQFDDGITNLALRVQLLGIDRNLHLRSNRRLLSLGDTVRDAAAIHRQTSVKKGQTLTRLEFASSQSPGLLYDTDGQIDWLGSRC